MTPAETAAILKQLDGWPVQHHSTKKVQEALAAAVEMIERLEAAETAWKISDQTVYDLTEKVIPNIQEKLEAAEKERDAMRAKIEQMEKQEPK